MFPTTLISFHSHQALHRGRANTPGDEAWTRQKELLSPLDQSAGKTMGKPWENAEIYRWYPPIYRFLNGKIRGNHGKMGVYFWVNVCKQLWKITILHR